MDDTDYNPGNKDRRCRRRQLIRSLLLQCSRSLHHSPDKSSRFSGAVIGPDGFDGIVPDYITGNMADYNKVYFATTIPQRMTAKSYRALLLTTIQLFGETPNALAALGYDGMNMLFKAIGEAGTTKQLL